MTMQPDVLSTETLLARTVAQLPTQGLGNGALAFATDGRKATEAAGSGSGVPVWYDAGAGLWRTFYDNSDVSGDPDMLFNVSHAEHYISATAATVISNTDDFFIVNGTFTHSVIGTDFTHSAGRLTYTGARTKMFHIFASWSFSSGSVNQDVQMGVRKSGVIVTASIITRRLAVANDVGSSAMHAMITLATDDIIDIAVRNTTGSNNVTFDKLTLGVMDTKNDVTGITIP